MARKRPEIDLGRATPLREEELEQLFVAEQDAEQTAGVALKAIRLDAIEPDPAQPRSTFPPDSLAELAASIAQNGVIQPIEVVQIERHRYRIVHGERRWRAAQMAGLQTIPAVVQRREYDEITRYTRQLVENIQREDLNDVDRAEGLVRLQVLLQQELNAEAEAEGKKPWSTKATWAKVGERIGNTRQRIHQLTRLLELPEEIKSAVRDGRLSERETRIYHRLPPTQQVALHRARQQHNLNSESMRHLALYLQENPAASVAEALAWWQAQQGASVNHTVLEQIERQLTHIQIKDLTARERQATQAHLQTLAASVQALIQALQAEAS